MAEHLGSVVQLPCRVTHSLPQLQLLGIPCALLASLGTCMHTAVLTRTHVSTHCTCWCAPTWVHTAHTDVHTRKYTLHILMCTHMHAHCNTDVHPCEYTLHILTCTHMSIHCTYWCTRTYIYIAHTDVHLRECTVHTNNKKQTFKRGFKNCHCSMTKAPKCAHRTFHHRHTPKGYRISTI